MSNTRITVASTSARIDGLEAMLAQILTHLTTPEHVTATAVAEKVEAAGVAPVVAPARTRKASTTKATTKAVRTVTLATAAKRVEAGAKPFEVMVKSSTTGEPIPYGLVLRAQKAAQKAAEKGTTAEVAPAPKGAKGKAAKATTVKPTGASAGVKKADALKPLNRAASKRMGKYTPAQWAVKFADAEFVKACLADLSKPERDAVKPFLADLIERATTAKAGE